jgi:hypothetical protein
MVISETTVNQFHVEEDALEASGREAEITDNNASQRLPMTLVGSHRP